MAPVLSVQSRYLIEYIFWKFIVFSQSLASPHIMHQRYCEMYRYLQLDSIKVAAIKPSKILSNEANIELSGQINT